MHLVTTLPWSDPLSMARTVADGKPSWVLLYSGMRTPYSGRYSLLALLPREQLSGASFDPLASVLSHNRATFDNAWFGYLGYGLKDALESLPEDAPFHLALPHMQMVRFGLILQFDHEKQVITVWAEGNDTLRYIPQPSTCTPCAPVIHNLSSNMTRQEYIEHVQTIREAIFRGDLYQANLTRKFFGRWQDFHPADLFARLCHISPAPYAACMRFEKHWVLSSSPEQFLHISSDGLVDTRPIKGSAPRYDDPAKDAAAKHALTTSEKDRAENLMIVDLSRNDLSRHCIPGSVTTHGLFDITSYATVHHMASTVQGKKTEDCSTLDVVKGCFPPGSMTGAPKIQAMKLCTQLERHQRGIYAGALGWFGGDGSADLSVVIRTLILQDDYFEFQVGGAIVADSEPIKEWEETLVKARGIAGALGISIDELATI